MNTIYFRQIEKQIGQRTNQIIELKQQIPKLLTIDEKLKVVVDPDYQQQAVSLICRKFH